MRKALFARHAPPGRVERVAPRRVEALGLYHVLPGTRVLTAAFADPDEAPAKSSRVALDAELRTYAVDELPDLARRTGCRSVFFGDVAPAWSLEALAPALDLVRRARLVTILQTRGESTAAAAACVAPRLDAASVHVSTMNDEVARRHGHVAPHLLRENLRVLRSAGAWVEVSTQLEPGVNDSDADLLELALSLRAIDRAIPWHVRCIPGASGLLSNWAPTAIERAVEAGARAGLEYVYAADAPGGDRELTFCPTCRDVVLIERFLGEPHSYLADGLRCPRCRQQAHGIFQPKRAVALA
jgi:pyruvate formate lyase activating enzyme